MVHVHVHVYVGLCTCIYLLIRICCKVHVWCVGILLHSMCGSVRIFFNVAYSIILLSPQRVDSDRAFGGAATHIPSCCWRGLEQSSAQRINVGMKLDILCFISVVCDVAFNVCVYVCGCMQRLQCMLVKEIAVLLLFVCYPSLGFPLGL